MPGQKRSNLAIWKVESDHHLFPSLTVEQKITKIINNFNSKKDVKDEDDLLLKEMPLENNKIEEKKIKIFHKKRKSSGWEKFIGNLIKKDNEQNKDVFFNINNDFLCFIYDDKDLFLITAGAGYHAIQSFIDESFPLEVAKKIFTGDFNHAEIRDLTGITYAKAENFRRSYTFSHQEAFGKIWKKLSGKIDPKVITNTPELSAIIDPEKKNNAEMKSSFTFRKSVTFEEIVKLIKVIQGLPELDDDKKRKFKFLDTFREIKGAREKESLKISFLRTLYSILNTENFYDAKDYDFCHPSEIFSFFSGCGYVIGNDELKNSDYPSAEDILRIIKDKNLVNLSSFENFQKTFENLTFSFKSEDDDQNLISTNILRYFHGELCSGGKNYFFIDGKWYEPQGTFLESLLEDFVKEIFDDGVFANNVKFLDWSKNPKGKYDEGEFNELQAKKDNFYLGDKIFVKTGKGKIEIFDLLHVKDGKIYIIQVKNGFGASVRDACSQIQMAAEIIEEDLKNGSSILKEYFKEWSQKDENNLSLLDFMRLFSDNERVYIFACSTSQEFTKEDFEKKKLESSIAQFEVLGLKQLFKGRGNKFNIQHIKKSIIPPS